MRLRIQISIIMTLLFVSYSFAAVTLDGTTRPMNNHFIPSQDILTPTEVSVEGSIVDNYANFSYQMLFDNNASAIDNEIEWMFELQEGIRLSNISIIRGNETFWGRASPEQEAIDQYNKSVAANETAVLVVSTQSGYLVSMNVEAGTSVSITVYAEGILTRNLGKYQLQIPISIQNIITADFELDLEVVSNWNQLAGWSLTGISGFDVTTFSEGIRLDYSGESIVLPSEIVLEYILERQIGGGQLLTYSNGSQNFFTYLLAPIITEVSEQAHRQYVFVLDRSGSMGGNKIVQAKQAFSSMIDDMGEDDLFNVVSFSADVTSMWVEPHSASAVHKSEAKAWVNALDATGGTNFHGASITGLETFTSGENVKAMLILSDGRPTTGSITSTQGILSAISEANSLGVSISTVAFGENADESLMVNIAAQNHGFYTKILDGDDASTKILDFYKTFGTPIANDYEINIEGGTLISSTQPLSATPFFNGTEIVITGCYEESLTITTTIDYVTGSETYVSSTTTADPDNSHVEYIWAQHRISYLLWQIECEGATDVLKNQVVSIGLQYGIIVKGYTALILTVYYSDYSSEESYYDPGVAATYTTYNQNPYVDAAPYYGAEPYAFDPTLGLVGGIIVPTAAASIVILGILLWKYKIKT